MRKRHGNYNKRATAKQTAAQKRNFAIFRLRGIESSLIGIANELGDEAKSALCGAHCYVREALIAETDRG